MMLRTHATRSRLQSEPARGSKPWASFPDPAPVLEARNLYEEN